MEYKIEHLTVVDSTNKYLKDNCDIYDNFSFVYADTQTAGKGRGDHTWESTDKANLLCSMLIKDEKILKRFNYVSLKIAVIIKKSLNYMGIKNVSLKWPNDVYVNDTKICGILLEGQLPKYMVIGIGLNANQKNFGELSATSISKETNRKINIDELAKFIYIQLVKNLSHIHPVSTIHKFNRSNYLKDKAIRFTYNQITMNGIAQKVDNKGALIVVANQEKYHLNADEITILK